MNDTTTLPELEELLTCAPLDLEAFCDRMEGIVAHKDRVSQAESRKAVRAALMACALPGHVVDAEFAALIDQAIVLAGKLKQDCAVIREALTHARTLMDTLGKEDPRTFAAVIKAINLQDPGCTDRMMKECGINLPKPDRCTPAGEPLLSLDALADALCADPAELLATARELEAVGLVALHTGASHVLQ